MKFILTYSDFLYTIIIYVLVQARLNPLLTVRSIRISQPCPSSTKQQLATQFISATDIDHNGINVYLVSIGALNAIHYDERKNIFPRGYLRGIIEGVLV
ncbi:hypothetical protein OCU04_004514 [Sclerotinia nivalis]|uniref:Uncharacterized protein n=1 Tax=Sclerotinia nivalis TaxID=352851 RepID=A0A9X0DMG9_9HELO|nr:hypothetical protein OCU04_004514 [Sclerotinia nivalis]